MHKIGLLVSAGLICTAAHAADDSLTNRQGDITPLCGTKPMIVGVSDGYGGNTWRKTGLAEVKDELSRCKNVKRIIYSNANGDPQKANSDINSMVAQGVNVLIMLPDFGAVQLPAMRAAMKAGVAVVPYSAQIAGVPGRDYVVNVVGTPGRSASFGLTGSEPHSKKATSCSWADRLAPPRPKISWTA